MHPRFKKLFHYCLLAGMSWTGLLPQSLPGDSDDRHAIVAPSISDKFTPLMVDRQPYTHTTNCLLQDRLGFLWIGSYEGLMRYDGYRLRTFRNDPNNSNSLSDNVINALIEDRLEDVLWIGTEAGLDRFDLRQETFTHFRHDPQNPHSLSSNYVLALYQEADNNRLWIGTYSGGLTLMEPLTARMLRLSAEDIDISSISTRAFVQDGAGRLWAGTSKGLFYYDSLSAAMQKWPSTPEIIESAGGAGVIKGQIWSMLAGSRGLLWIGTDHGVYALRHLADNRRQLQYWQLPSQNTASLRPRYRVQAITEDQDNRIWIGTFRQGLFLIDNAEIDFNSKNPQLKNISGPRSTSIRAILQDQSADLWVAGLSGVDNHRNLEGNFRLINNSREKPQQLANNFVWSVHQDQKGMLWIGSIDGLTRYNPMTGKSQHWHQQRSVNHGLSGKAILSIAEDPATGYLWLGTFAGGLNRFDPKNETFRHWRYRKNDPAGLINDRIYEVRFDRLGKLWIGTDKGLDRFDPSTEIFEHFVHDPKNPGSISAGNIRAIYHDPQGSTWIGLTGGGLNRFSPETQQFEHWSASRDAALHLSHGVVASITATVTQNGRALWLGTGAGLNKLEFDSLSGNESVVRIRHYTTGDGLPDNAVRGLLADAFGSLWLATDYGLSRFDPDSEEFSNHKAGYAMPPFTFNIGATASGIDGNLFFGGEQGLLSFFPSEVAVGSRSPKLVFTELRIFNRPVQIGREKTARLTAAMPYIDEVQLSYRDFDFAIQFAALDYRDPLQNKYSYRLDGFHQDWIDLGSKREVSFTNLDPGEYRLRIRGASSDGQWSAGERSLTITISPPFWKTWWFRLLMLMVVVMFFYGIYRLRINRLLSVEKTRNRIARDLHDDLSASLGSISHFSEAVRRRSEDFSADSAKYLDLISAVAGEAQDSIDDIIWAINSENDSWAKTAAKMKRFAGDLLESRNITYEIKIPPDLPIRKFDMEKRRHIWLIYKEILTNVTRHSKSKKVAVQVQLHNKQLKLSISDDGLGFDAAAERQRNGLKNIRGRTIEIGGSWALRTAPGEGTTWVIKVPVS